MDYQFLFDQFNARQSGIKQSQQRRLYHCLRDTILRGQLKAGMQLPGSRTLATELKISRNTVLYAYEQLITEGLLLSAGRGTLVASNLSTLVSTPVAANIAKPRQLSARAQLTPWPTDPHGAFTAFMSGVPALAHFPIAIWRRCLERVWRELNFQQLDYANAVGEPILRVAIAEHLTSTRGLVCSAEQIFITDGTQQSLGICAHALASAGDIVWIENPGYGGAFQSLKAAELDVRGIAVDAEGIAPTKKEWEKFTPKFIYTTPSHQFPLGSVMSVVRRLELIESAKQYDALIIEDDYDSEFRRDGPPLPAMQGLVADAPVIYLGTFSKTLFPALRIGYMVVPKGLVEPFAGILKLGHLRGRSADQLALAEFLRAGHFSNHLKKMRRLYAARRDALVAAINKHLGHIAIIYGGSSGIHLTIALPEALNDVSISRAALAQDVYTQPLSKLATGSVLCNGLMLGYAQVPEAEMDKYISVLANVISEYV
ncbi:PLP-dependent aminotransferase family protein [Cellvibrio sp. UBA7671]|uniref:MocR-like pyridoxine biosynthesis transcription factor PdxR n=1 Tax=Cellvibrio sp. UBA7671 TaxID=1946312 RepID=UPI002F34F569